MKTAKQYWQFRKLQYSINIIYGTIIMVINHQQFTVTLQQLQKKPNNT